MSKDTSFTLLIVLYKSDFETSTSLQSLNKIAGQLSTLKLQLVIWDNSPSELENRSIIEKYFSKFDYVHTPQNISLAKIYNQTIEKFSEDSEFLIIFDQDSTFDLEYFETLQDAISNNVDINLFVPLIKVGSQIVSPGDFHFIKGKYWNREQYGKIEAKNKLIITSGMVVNLNYLKNNFSGFNEELKLYGIDSEFMIQYAKNNQFFYVFDYLLTHHIAEFEPEGIDAKVERFLDHKHATRIICKNISILHLMLANLYLLIKSLIMCFKFKDLRFLK